MAGRNVDTLAKLVLISAFAYALYWFWQIAGPTLFPVVTGLVIAYLLHPFLQFLRGKGLPKGLAILLVFFSFLIAFFAFIAVLYPVLAREVRGVIERFPALIDTMEHDALPWLQANAGLTLPSTVSEGLSAYGTELKDSLPGLLNKTGTFAASALVQTGSVLSGLANAILIPIFTLFFLMDLEAYGRFLTDLIPERGKSRLGQTIERVNHVVSNWFRAQIELACILSLAYGTSLGIAFAFSGFGFLNGFAIGALTGFLNLIPYVGVAIGFALALIMALVEWNGFGPLLGIVAAFGTVQLTDAYVITPRIVGDKVGLSTLAVLVSLLTGGALFGLLGMLLAIPCAAILKTLWPDMREAYKRSAFYTG